MVTWRPTLHGKDKKTTFHYNSNFDASLYLFVLKKRFSELDYRRNILHFQPGKCHICSDLTARLASSYQFNYWRKYKQFICRLQSDNPGQNILGHLRKLGTKRHFAKLTHFLPLKKAWGCCYKLESISAVPLSPKQCWWCWNKKWMHNANTARGRGVGGRRREWQCATISSYCVSVPRVLTRVRDWENSATCYSSTWEMQYY